MQYEFERRKYAQDLIDFDKKWSKLFSGKPRTETNKNGVSPEEMMKYILHSPRQSIQNTDGFITERMRPSMASLQGPVFNTLHHRLPMSSFSILPQI